MYANSLHGNRDIPGATACYPQSVRSRKACGRNLDMHVTGKSDEGVVSMKRANKGAQLGYSSQPTTGGVRGEKALGQGEFIASGRDWHTEAKSSVDRVAMNARVCKMELVVSRPRQRRGLLMLCLWTMDEI